MSKLSFKKRKIIRLYFFILVVGLAPFALVAQK